MAENGETLASKYRAGMKNIEISAKKAACMA
jgi:hypothetical protein